MTLYIDFETYSEIDVTKAGAWRYAEHPTTDLLCMAWAWRDGEVYVWTPGDPLPARLTAGRIVAHNCEFELAMWRLVAQPRYGFPEIRPEQLVDTAVKAAAHGLPRSLEGAAEQLNVSRKDKRGKQVMLKLCKPHRGARLTPRQAPLDFRVLYQYCADDVRATRAVDQALPDLRPDDQAMFTRTLHANYRGVPVDARGVRGALRYLDQHAKALREECRALTGGISQAQHQKLLQWINDRGVALFNLQAPTVEATLRTASLPAKVRRVLEIRRDLTRSSTSKFKRMQEMLCADGRIKGNLVFHGASTGRFNGAGVQLLNMPRGAKINTDLVYWALQREVMDVFYADPMDALRTAVRGAILAPPGQRLRVGDFSQIETRVLLWLAEDSDALEEFRQGLDPYKTMAERVYRVAYDAVTDEQRQLGKNMVLGCGFGQGARNFERYCAERGLAISADQARAAVDAYRDKYAAVVDLWDRVDRCFRKTLSEPRRTFGTGPLRMRFDPPFLRMRLPSGRRIAWNNPRVTDLRSGETGFGSVIRFDGVLPMTRQWGERRTWGGDLVQSATQATAYDVLAFAWANVEDAGYPVIAAVHDELIALTPREHGSLKEFLAIMTRVPPWLDGLPIGSEGYEAKRYRK